MHILHNKIQKNTPEGVLCTKLEPHAGIEPASSAWQADIIAVIRMRRLLSTGLIYQ